MKTKKAPPRRYPARIVQWSADVIEEHRCAITFREYQEVGYRIGHLASTMLGQADFMELRAAVAEDAGYQRRLALTSQEDPAITKLINTVLDKLERT